MTDELAKRRAHPTNTRIVALLGEVYKPAGVAIWLRTRNVNLGGVPADMCRTAEGRARVLAEAESLAMGGMVAT